MKTNKQLWYSVENGADGSATPHFFWSREEAEEHQEQFLSDEAIENGWAWAEPCCGPVVLPPTASDGEVPVSGRIVGGEPIYDEIGVTEPEGVE